MTLLTHFIFFWILSFFGMEPTQMKIIPTQIKDHSSLHVFIVCGLCK